MKRLPNRIYLDITNKCNQRCMHCSIDAGSESDNLLSIRELKSLVKQTKEMGVGKIVFSGGEPLSRTGAFDLFEEAARIGLDVTVLTNGSLIDHHAAQFFKLHNINIKISLDGARAETHDYLRGEGAFSRIMQVFDIIRVLDNDKREVHFTIHRKNQTELSGLPALLEQIHIKNLVVGTIKPSGRAVVNKELLIPPEMIPYIRRKIRQLKQDPRIDIREFNSKGWQGFGCPAVCDKFGIGADGRATTCVFLGEEYVGRSTRDMKLFKLWEEYLSRGNIFKPNVECAKCEWLAVTGGGCRARALYFNGDINAPDPYCCAMKKHHENIVSLAG